MGDAADDHRDDGLNDTLLDDDLEQEVAALSEMTQRAAELQQHAQTKTDEFMAEIEARKDEFEAEMRAIAEEQEELRQRTLKQQGRVEILQDQRRKLLGEDEDLDTPVQGDETGPVEPDPDA